MRQDVNDAGSEDLCRAVARAQFPGAQLKQWQRLTGGVSAEVYCLHLEEPAPKKVVLRIHGESHSGHPAQLEYELLDWLSSRGGKVAKPLCFDASGSVLEDQYLLLDFVEGSTHVEPGEVTPAIKKMAVALRGIHQMPIDGLPKLPTRTEPIPEVFDYLPEGEAYRPLEQWLRNTQSQFSGEPTLLHGDYWPENVMWRHSDIVAILDWEDAATGDPLSDVACAMLELSYLYGRDGAEQFLRAYETDQPIDRERLALWQIYVAAAAQKYMGLWGLPVEREAHMRSVALGSIREAGDLLFRV